MKVKEEHTDTVIAALVERIKSLEVDVWFRDEKIAKLQEELKIAKGERK